MEKNIKEFSFDSGFIRDKLDIDRKESKQDETFLEKIFPTKVTNIFILRILASIRKEISNNGSNKLFLKKVYKEISRSNSYKPSVSTDKIQRLLKKSKNMPKSIIVPRKIVAGSICFDLKIKIYCLAVSSGALDIMKKSGCEIICLSSLPEYGKLENINFFNKDLKENKIII